jgi:hypothetical protein
VLRNHATVLPIEEEESEATVATSCTPGAPPPYQVLQQDAQHVWQELLYVVVLLFVFFFYFTPLLISHVAFNFGPLFFLSCNPTKCNVVRYCVFYRELGRVTSLYCETRKPASGMVYVHMLIMYCTILTGFLNCKPDYCEGLIL